METNSLFPPGGMWWSHCALPRTSRSPGRSGGGFRPPIHPLWRLHGGFVRNSITPQYPAVNPKAGKSSQGPQYARHGHHIQIEGPWGVRGHTKMVWGCFGVCVQGGAHVMCVVGGPKMAYFRYFLDHFDPPHHAIRPTSAPQRRAGSPSCPLGHLGCLYSWATPWAG